MEARARRCHQTRQKESRRLMQDISKQRCHCDALTAPRDSAANDKLSMAQIHFIYTRSTLSYRAYSQIPSRRRQMRIRYERAPAPLRLVMNMTHFANHEDGLLAHTH